MLAGLARSVLDKPAHQAAHEHGAGGADRDVKANRKGERADAEQFNGDDDEDAEHHQAPRQPLVQDAADDGGHQTRLRRRGSGAADTLRPLHLDVAGLRVVEVLTVRHDLGAERVEQPKIVHRLFGGGAAGDHGDLAAIEALALHRDAFRQCIHVHGNGRHGLKGL